MQLKHRIFDPEFKEFYIHEYGVRKKLQGYANALGVRTFQEGVTQIVLVIAYTTFIDK